MPRPRQRAWALALRGVFGVSFVATLAFFVTMGRYWSPDGEWAAAIETVWALSYTLMLVGLGGTVMALLLVRRRGGARRDGLGGLSPASQNPNVAQIIGLTVSVEWPRAS